MIQQLQDLFLTVQEFLIDLPDFLASIKQQAYELGPFEFDLSQFDLTPLVEQLLAAIQPALGQISALMASLATGAIESAVRIIFILAVAYFLTVDNKRISASMANLSVPGHTEDSRRLRLALGRIWNAVLRGQLLVVVSAGALTWILFSALEVRYSLGLGVLGGVAKFILIIGPVKAGLVAALVALFQPSNWFGLTPLGHSVLIVVCVFILDQAIDYLLGPRIMGTSLNLHPVLILIGLLIGVSLAGVIGLLLSSPTMTSLILLGRYTYRKMVDLDPWDPPIDVLGEQRKRESRLLRLMQRVGRSIRSRNRLDWIHRQVCSCSFTILSEQYLGASKNFF